MSIEAGNILRETREQKGVSIKEASDSLHIRIPYLQALESGRAEIIPSNVQARGFLRIYSEYLGLNSADVIQEWDNPGSTSLSSQKTEEQSPAGTLQKGNDPANLHTAGFSPVNPLPQQNTPGVYYNNPAAYIQNTNIQPNTDFRSPAGMVPNQNGPQPTAAEIIPDPIPEEVSSEDSVSEKQKKKQKDKNKPPKKPLFKKRAPKEAENPVQEESAQDLFNNIGQELGNRRNILSLSLEDCESQTLIRSIYLNMMESGNFEQLPSLIQARGMLNNYASFLDLDVDDIMLKFATALQLLSQKKNRRGEDKKHKPTKTAGRLKKFFTPDLFIGVFVIVGIAGIIIYSAITITAYRRSVSEPTPDLGISLIGQYLDTTRTPDFIPAASSTPEMMPDTPWNVLSSNDETTVDEETAEITSSQPVQLFVTANQRALMTVSSDGKEVFSGRTLPNNTYPFDAENLIELTISNADAISIVYNQQNLGRPGKLGEVMTIDFSPFLAATPTPQFSPTPTNTYEPTYTPRPETPLPTNTSTPYIP